MTWLSDSVIQAKAARLVEQDFEEELKKDGLRHWPEGDLPQSWMAVPMIAEDRTIGVIVVVNRRKPRAFGENGLRVLTSAARQAAVAIENARLIDQRDRKIASLRALYEMGQRLNSGIRLDEPEILRIIHQQASALMDTSNLYVALYEAATDTVHFPLMYVDGQSTKVESRSGGKGRTEWIIRSREPIFIETRDESVAWYEKYGQEYIGEPFASWLGVPMIAGDKVLGVIATYHKTQDFVYTGDDKEILSLMANQAAVAIENARLYEHLEERVQERTKQLEKLYEASLRVSSKIELPQVLLSIAENVNELLGADTATIFPYNSDQDEFGEGVRTGQVSENLRRPSNQGLASQLVKRGERLYQSAQGLADLERTEIDHKPVLAYAAIPLLYEQQCLGLLFIDYFQDHEFSEEEKRLSHLFGQQAANALNVVHQYELAQKLAKAERWAELGRLAGSLAHRIGNTGGTIRLRANELAEYLDVKLPGDSVAQTAIETIASSNQYLLDLSTVLIKPYRAIEEHMALSDVTLLVNGAIKSAKISAEIKVETDYAPGLPLVKINRFFIEAFLEIITNAVEAMQSSPIKALTIRAAYDDNWVKVIFRDTGIGIPEGNQEKIFELFTTRNAQKSNRHFGFGLWWVRTFLRDIGGDIKVESQVNQGTTFTILLPRQEAR
jgi:GAF domain-containing protein